MRPTGKDYIWGGSRLNESFAKNIDMQPLAETWECSTHPDGPSYADGGEFDGMSLIDILKEHPEFLGTHPRLQGELPILMKLIDAKEDLSVQVHPNDEYAFNHEGGQLGKTEMWYILDATEDATLVYGLSHKVSRETLRRALEKSKYAPKGDTSCMDRYLQKVPVHKGDLFYIEAGTIHAIGGGALIAEIQESSNLTYRLYDYNREDKNGNRRELHIDKALEVSNLEGAGSPKQPMRVLRYKPGLANEMLCRCKYFEVHRMLVNAKDIPVEFSSDEASFRALLCTSGQGTITYGDNFEIVREFKAGQCIFVPANSVMLKLSGRAELLDVRC